jgi:hypothetical protein
MKVTRLGYMRCTTNFKTRKEAKVECNKHSKKKFKQTIKNTILVLSSDVEKSIVHRGGNGPRKMN